MGSGASSAGLPSARFCLYCIRSMIANRFLLFLHKHNTTGGYQGPMAGRRQQLRDTVLGSLAAVYAKLPEYVFEAVVKLFEMFHHCFKRILWQFGPRCSWRVKHGVTELLHYR
jgi:hypothetical protein